MTILNLPNQLTISRILAVPLIMALVAHGHEISCLLAAAVFGIAAFTDIIDGYLARKSNLVTSLGKFLDPLADKVLVCAVLVMLVEQGRVPAWAVVVIICRDLMVTGLRAIAADEGIVIAADRYGKLKTVLQMIALGPLIIHYPWLGIPFNFIGMIVLYLALLLTVYSGYNYFQTFFSDLKKK
jgi:CDP-diacylglycerol--glycerol-3-phosphate 3-phosphatidyltransferase